LWGYAKGSSQLLGFDVRTGSLNNVRWLGEASANQHTGLTSLNLGADDRLWGYANGSSQLLGFDVRTGSLTDVRWRGEASANQYAGLSTLALAPVPEPDTWALVLGGLAALGALARRRLA
jgi:hypothetical protein